MTEAVWGREDLGAFLHQSACPWAGLGAKRFRITWTRVPFSPAVVRQGTLPRQRGVIFVTRFWAGSSMVCSVDWIGSLIDTGAASLPLPPTGMAISMDNLLCRVAETVREVGLIQLQKNCVFLVGLVLMHDRSPR